MPLQKNITINVLPAGGPPPWLDITFDKYADSTDLKAASHLYNSAQDGWVIESGDPQITLDPTRAPPGSGLSKSMRITFLDRSGSPPVPPYDPAHKGYCSDYTIGRDWDWHRTDITEMWVEALVWWDPNFYLYNPECYGTSAGGSSPSGTTLSTSGHKFLFGLVNGNYNGLTLNVGRFDSIMFAMSLTQGGPSVHWPAEGVFASGSYFPVPPDVPLIQGNVASIDKLVGQWNVCRWHWKITQTFNFNASLNRWFGDGICIVDFNGHRRGYTDICTTRTASALVTAPNNQHFTGLALGRNMNNGPLGRNISLNWGRVRVWSPVAGSGDPGWGF
jgi:hypothetical protein